MVGNGKSFECAIDGRKFATKKALAQHKKAVHECPPKDRPRSSRGSNGNVRNKNNSMSTSLRRARGSDILFTANMSTSSQVGDVVYAAPLTPSNFEKTRFQRESVLFSRWRPIRMIIEIIGMAGAMTSGSFTAGWTADPDNWLDNTPQTPVIIGAMKPSVTTSLSKKAKLKIPKSTLQKWFLVDSDEDAADTTHGKFFVCLSGSVGNVTGTSQVSLMIKLHWEVEFRDPSIPTDKATGGSIYADSGYENYFTDSSSDWADGKKLSLKHTQGGSMVPFTGIKPSVVYLLDPAAKLTYNTAKGEVRRIYYGVEISGSTNRNMAVFESLQNAKKYAQKGDNTYCIDYYSAGAVVTPSNPAWSQQAVVDRTKVDVRISSLQQQIDKLTKQLSEFGMVASTSSSFQQLPLIEDET